MIGPSTAMPRAIRAALCVSVRDGSGFEEPQPFCEIATDSRERGLVGSTQAWRYLCAPGSAQFVPTGFSALDSGCPISD
jgi:hypothetical protein